MHYTSLQLRNYRSYFDFSVEFEPGVNIVVGPNASGKTNLLEAIQVISRGSSFRVADKSLIMHGKNIAKIHAITDESRERSIILSTDESMRLTKEIRINDVAYRRMTSEKSIPTVLFEPEHLRMIHGSPDGRRDYLDSILSLVNPQYKTNLNRYRKALSQRNRLLKTGNKILPDDVFVWDVQLSEYGSRIDSERKQLIDRINQTASDIYSAVSGEKSSLVLEYSNTISADYASVALKIHQANINNDHLRGFTGFGPHRDDVKFILNGVDAQKSASRGETRTIVLVCKIIEIVITKEKLDMKPIVLLDDVFSELDGSRRLALTKYLNDHQTIITTTDADAIVKSFLGGFNVIATEG